MDTLLLEVLDAHGGLSNWKTVRQLKVQMSLDGPFWGARGWPNALRNLTVVMDAQREHLTMMPFTSPSTTSVFDVNPERVVFVGLNGDVIEERHNPRGSFPTMRDETQWDAIQLAYFTSAAVWNYLAAPFVFAMPDVEAKEIDPWIENGETWRRLAVTFPSTNANHNREQTFYYDADFMQRRMDYSPDVTGNPPVAHYTHDYKKFDGFMFPTRRRVLLHNDAGHANQTFEPITIDVARVEIER